MPGDGAVVEAFETLSCIAMMLRQLRGLRAGRFRFEVFQGVTLSTDEHADVFLLRRRVCSISWLTMSTSCNDIAPSITSAPG